MGHGSKKPAALKRARLGRRRDERHVKTTLVPNCSIQVIHRALTPPRVFSVVTEGVTFRTAGGMYDDT
jgi:hypothetical protein